MKSPHFLASLLAIASLSGLVRAGEVVQIDASSVFNMRPINTVVAGKLVPMNSDIDGAGGIATKAAAKAMGKDDLYAMPDDGIMPDNNQHPEIVMSYAKDDGKMNLARKSRGEDSFVFSVPLKNYSKLWLFCSSGQGPSTIKVDLKYSDQSTDSRAMTVPDWFWELKPGDPDRCYVAANLSKWGPTKQLEEKHHFIFGLNIHPNPAKTLEKIMVTKERPGIMAFFGATGQVGN